MTVQGRRKGGGGGKGVTYPGRQLTEGSDLRNNFKLSKVPLKSWFPKEMYVLWRFICTSGLTCLAICYQVELVPKQISCYAINRYCSLLFTSASLLFLHVECSANGNSGESILPVCNECFNGNCVILPNKK